MSLVVSVGSGLGFCMEEYCLQFLLLVVIVFVSVVFVVKVTIVNVEKRKRIQIVVFYIKFSFFLLSFVVIWKRTLGGWGDGGRLRGRQGAGNCSFAPR